MGVMRREVILVLAGCGATPPAPQPAPPPMRARRADPVFDGSTLGDPGIEAKFTRHAYLAREGGMRFAREGEAIHVDAPRELETLEPYPVVGEAPRVIRLVEDYDDARIAIWVERATLAPTVRVASELLDPAGAAGDGVHGVWLAAGTQITAGPAEHHSALRSITIRVPELAVSGKLPAATIGEVWTGPVPAPFDPETTRDDRYLEEATPIYLGAGVGRVLATTTEQTTAKLIAAAGAWTEVELQHDGLRVRGFVRSDAVTTLETFPGRGKGGLSGMFAISDTDRFAVPEGTCLYDHDEGSVVGVTLATRERYGYLRTDTPWSHVYIGTAHWEQPLLTILRAGDSWESCVAK